MEYGLQVLHAVALGVTIPAVFHMACESHWTNLNQGRKRPDLHSSDGDEALAMLPEVLVATRPRTSNALVGCICRAIADCTLPLPVKVCECLDVFVVVDIPCSTLTCPVGMWV